jgi:toxin secretion/phage lysis holin
MRESLPAVVKVAIGAAAIAWGNLHPMVQILVVLMLLDIVTGVLSAYVNQSIDSDVSFRGVAKKALILCLVGTASYVGGAVDLPLGAAVAGFYGASEGISVLENAAAAGLPVPKALRDALSQLGREAEGAEGKEAA